MSGKATVVLSHPQEQCATFFWQDMPEYYLGYRFLEGEPQVTERPLDWGEQEVEPSSEPPATTKTTLPKESCDPWGKSWVGAFQSTEPSNPLVAFQSFADGSAWCLSGLRGGEQTLEHYFQPEASGIKIWMRLATAVAIPGAFLVQQCLRFTGLYNQDWRKKIAHMPVLSELDLQAMGQPNLTMTYARGEEGWVQFPVEQTRLPTHTGAALFSETTNRIVGGLVVRESFDRKVAPEWYFERVAAGFPFDLITAGMAWERTAIVSNRHPADCVHAAVDFGPLQAGESRILSGRVYWIEGGKDSLLNQVDYK